MSSESADFDLLRSGRAPVLVFAPSRKSPPYQEQVRLLDASREAFEERDALIIYVLHEGPSIVDGDRMEAQAASALRSRYGVGEDAFAVVLVNDDGTERKRYTAPVKADALLAALDQVRE